MIERISDFYKHENSNIHRAAHALAARATDAYEAAREKTRRFLNAPSARDIIFVRGATEGINFVAQSWGRANVKEGDEILVAMLIAVAATWSLLSFAAPFAGAFSASRVFATGLAGLQRLSGRFRYRGRHGSRLDSLVAHFRVCALALAALVLAFLGLGIGQL